MFHLFAGDCHFIVSCWLEQIIVNCISGSLTVIPSVVINRQLQVYFADSIDYCQVYCGVLIDYYCLLEFINRIEIKRKWQKTGK